MQVVQNGRINLFDGEGCINVGNFFGSSSADGISQFNPDSVAILAERLMRQRLRTLLDSDTYFAFEANLAAHNFARLLINCKTKGYTINLIYFWLQSPEMAIERVQPWVESSGLSIPEIEIISLILLFR
ncbi:hypothetical protein QUA20_11130 [Microcoleus sp. Pol7_A1]|uniref:hypothetical protein n=1 Tax=Microcoleus sp. Pol7_A1 TaxID=2818893 RepID=UPI002FD2995C